MSFFLYGLATAWSLALNNVFCVSLHPKCNVNSNRHLPGIINKRNNPPRSLPRLLRNRRYNRPPHRHSNSQLGSHLVRLLHHPPGLRHHKRSSSLFRKQNLRNRHRNPLTHLFLPPKNSRPNQSHPKTHHSPRRPLHLRLPRRRSLPLRLDPLLPPRNPPPPTHPIYPPRICHIRLQGRRNPRPVSPITRRPPHRRKTSRLDPHRHCRCASNCCLARP